MEGRVLVVYSFFTDEDDDGEEVFFLFFSEITPRADCGKNRNSLYMVYWAPRLVSQRLRSSRTFVCYSWILEAKQESIIPHNASAVQIHLSEIHYYYYYLFIVYY